jgi:hypothetical protein
MGFAKSFDDLKTLVSSKHKMALKIGFKSFKTVNNAVWTEKDIMAIECNPDYEKIEEDGFEGTVIVKEGSIAEVMSFLLNLSNKSFSLFIR